MKAQNIKTPSANDVPAAENKVIYCPLADIIEEVRALDRMHLNKELDAIAQETDASVAVQAGIVNRLEQLVWQGGEYIGNPSDRTKNRKDESSWQECFPSDEDRDPYL